MPGVDYSAVPNDFAIEYHGSVSILKPLTLEAEEWCRVNLKDRQAWCCGACYNLEAREVKDMIIKIESASLTIYRPPCH